VLILILFAFLAGIVTVLSPCILPVLPIVLSGSVGAGKRRPLGIVAGFIVSFTFFTLFLTALVSRLGISAEGLRFFSIVVITLFGLSLLLPRLQVLLEKLFSKLSQFTPNQQQDGYYGGFLLGISLGLLWTPCVGPILASVISLALIGSVNSQAFLITLAYALGTGLPMLAITYGGRNLLNKTPWLTRHLGRIQQAFGVIMILTAAAIYFNLDRSFQTWLLDRLPGYGAGLTQLENADVVKKQLDKFGGQELDDMGRPLFEMQDVSNYPQAPELVGGTGWFNSEPLRFDDNLRGKVVLVDFWTYTCINCIRTFPHLVDWYSKYQDQGFVIVGVHSPEFEFEKDSDNVLAAMAQYGLEYPVVQDNDFRIWRAYNNRYWPAHYLVDKEGRIRYTHFGEGRYEETENKIRELLGEEQLVDGTMPDTTPARPQTPETYLGYDRADAYTYDNRLSRDRSAEYDFSSLPQDSVGLNGNWLVASEYAQAKEAGASLSLNFLAQQVHLVLTPLAGEGKLEVLLDGQPVPKQYWTADMNEQGFIPVTEARKYDLVDLGDDYGRHTLELRFTPGVAAYAFTFSS
jgi:cytochrome c biogenesis protein CcdA/thiol-disulfide isomerase/thioredoxin